MKKIILSLVLLFSVLFVPSFVLAQGGGSSLKDDMTSSLKKTGQSANYNTSQEGETALVSLIGSAIKVILSVLGIVLLALIIYAGYLWMIARGNENEVTKAKDIIQQAVIGLFIIVAAYVIADFVMDKLMEAVTNQVSTGTGTEEMIDLPY